MSKPLTYASVCDGIGAVHCAWQPLGWRCAWTSEIEAFPMAVVEHHWGFPNLGDMTRITDAQLEQHGRIDLLVGGTPCQSFSVAGLRKGLADPRGNLALAFLGLVGRARPEWVVWENVPGVLSSGKGRDFGTFLGGLGELGYGFAYCVLDAQYFGLAQRRKRVFVVGCAGDWRRAAAVLFERASLSGNPAPSRETGARIASSLTRGFGSGGADDDRAQGNWLTECANDFGERDTATALSTKNQRLVGDTETFVVHSLRADGFDASEDGTGRGTPIVAFTDLRGRGSEIRINGDCAEALHCAKGMSEQQAVAFEQNQRNEVRTMPISSSVKAENGMKNQTYVGFYPTNRQREFGNYDDITPAMKPGSSKGGNPPGVASNMRVRRIMPIEAERLQGFSDNYTAITFRKKPAADGPRYRALGNSMAVPVIAWIGQRIALISQRQAAA